MSDTNPSGRGDLVLTERRLRRRLTTWRLAFLVLLVVVAGYRFHAGHVEGGPHLDALTVDGVITDEQKRLDALDRAAKDPDVRGLILRVDSPGGSVAGGENLHDAIARFVKVKPVVAVMGGTAASAAYMISVPARRIFASNATLTGSIGVILESPDVSGLLGKLGVAVDELVSGPLKGQPSITSPLSPQGRQVLQAVVMDLYDQFVGIVASGRHMDPAKVRGLADGRVYTGHQALPLGLIDQIGTESDARDWLAANAGIARDTPVRPLDWQGPPKRFQMLTGLVKTFAPQGLTLDGPLALWQPRSQ
jgi:protease-4